MRKILFFGRGIQMWLIKINTGTGKFVGGIAQLGFEDCTSL